MTYLAARYHLTANETSRIDIATFGGGRSITRKYFTGGRIVNYYSQNDPLLMVDKRASLLSKMLNASTSRSVINGAQNATYNEIRDMKHNTTFVFLDGQLNHPIRDHGMEGPTYLLALQLEALEHKKRMTQLSTSVQTQKYYMRLGRKRIAKITGIHHFWEGVPFTVRSMRKRSARLTNIHNFFNVSMPAIFQDSTNDVFTEQGLDANKIEQILLASEAIVDDDDVDMVKNENSAGSLFEAVVNSAIKGLKNIFNVTIPTISFHEKNSSRIRHEDDLDSNKTGQTLLLNESVIDVDVDVHSVHSPLESVSNYAIKGLKNLFNVKIPAVSIHKMNSSEVTKEHVLNSNTSEQTLIVSGSVNDVVVDAQSPLDELGDYALKAFNVFFAD